MCLKCDLTVEPELGALHQKSSPSIAIRTLDNHRAAAVLREQGIAVQSQQDYLLLPAFADGELSRLTLNLCEQKVGVVRIEQREKSLEDIFLELTGSAVSL